MSNPYLEYFNKLVATKVPTVQEMYQEAVGIITESPIFARVPFLDKRSKLKRKSDSIDSSSKSKTRLIKEFPILQKI